MSSRLGNKNWNCPSDRELILRAKLKAGWCVHSYQFFRKEEHILEPELRLIENVVKKAEIIDQMERDRIAKMVCRLENMKRNAHGDGKANCSMCGIAFGHFRSSFLQCFDCCMAVCEKCRIDLPSDCQNMNVLCKICAENREVWKKCGGWFYGKLPPLQQLNCNEVLQNQNTVSWEHRAPDIVRLESFEPPEENHNDHSLYKNWAISSTPDLTSLEEETRAISKSRTKSFRKISVVEDVLGLRFLSLPESRNSNLSTSCPSLNASEEDDIREVPSRRHVLKKRILTPARKMMTKIAHHKNDNV